MQHELAKLGNGAHAFATQMLGSADDAADAVHDAIATALQRPEAWDVSKGSLKTWFMRVVRNRCIDMIRLRKAGGDTTDELVDPALGPEETLQIEQRDLALKNALARLETEQRQIIVLSDYVGFSYREIANVLDVPAGTVMSRLHRARLALKKELMPDDE
jgi:RNA polymerase sigma-70 factor (ECF subfamily)